MIRSKLRFNWIVLPLLLTTGSWSLAYTGIELEKEVRPFLKTYCFSCHGEEKQKGDRRFDTLASELADDDNLIKWQDILDLLNLGDMPPEEADLHPDEDEVLNVVAILTGEIAVAQALNEDQSPAPILRRLNRREYLNTVRDLFGFNMTLFDPTTGFPEDDEVDGFDNLGAALVTSSYLLENYLDAADQVIERAFDAKEKPEAQHWKFSPPLDYTTDPHSRWIRVERDRNPGYTSIFQGTKERFGYRPIDAIKQGVPHSGYYKIRIRAAGLNRNHPWDEDLIGTNTDAPIRLAVVSGKDSLGRMDLRQAGEQILARFDLPDNDPEWVEGTIWLDKGFLPRLTYDNGPYWFKGLPAAINERYPEKYPIAYPFPTWWEVCQIIRTPQIRIFGVELSGPQNTEWPTKAHKTVFGENPQEQNDVLTLLENFATKAFRRPVLQEELDSLIALYEHQFNAEGNKQEALKTTLKAVLCSPGFLYLPAGEVNGTPVPPDYQIASRLSYFLWSSMPDDELMALASNGRLQDPDILQEQTLRMLGHPKAEAFSKSFSDRWLTLYKLGEMPPDHNTFSDYYVGNLETAMRQETHLFFQHLLVENMDIGHFLESDFTFVNRSLARHYGWDTSTFEWPKGLVDQQFKKVQIPNQERGGLFGQASVLTVTANGIDTSPVIRGVWVLENILGSPPSPPPPDVEPIEPDTRGATTIREQLQKHRKVATCAECHAKIDPLGFALEGFDAVGGRREFYDNDRRLLVDTQGNLPDGTAFDGIEGLRSILAGRKDQFAHSLTDKMMVYAIGREMTIRDRPHINRATANLKKKGYGLRDLVLEVVSSEPFRITSSPEMLVLKYP
jgi:hypothetical protein